MAAAPRRSPMDAVVAPRRAPTMPLWSFLALLLAACRKPEAHPAGGAPASTTPAMAPDAGTAPFDAGPAAAIEPPPAKVRIVPAGAGDASIRSICFVRGDCRGTGKLDHTSFVERESADAVACESAVAPATCPNLLAGEADSSALCADEARLTTPPLPSEASPAQPAGGGRPRDRAKAALRALVAKGAPCTGDPPGARIRRDAFCDYYRPDGTLQLRQYSAELAGGGERWWFQELDEKGTVVREFVDCDAGHH